MRHSVRQFAMLAGAAVLCTLASVRGQEQQEPAAAEKAPSVATDGTYQYFEYQVITVPKKTLSAAAESMGLSRDSEPTDDLLPAIYKAGGYRVIGCAAGYADNSVPAEFKMMRSEFFPLFYIMPNEGDDGGFNGELPPPVMDDDDDDMDDPDTDAADDSDADAADDSEDDGDDGDDDGMPDYSISGRNNLAGIFPFFGDPTVAGNEFFLDIRPPRAFALESTMRKLSGFTNMSYGEWGNGQTPSFDDNSFSSLLAATRGKPMIVAKSMSGSTWTLHVFFSQDLPMPEKTAPALDNENKIVRLDFQIVRAKWTELCTAGETTGVPGVPIDALWSNLSAKAQLRDVYSPSFRMLPGQEPVRMQLNAKIQSVPVKWLPAQEPGIPAIPLDQTNVWTGTALTASAKLLDGCKTVKLDFLFEKTSQTGWRNYSYLFYAPPEMAVQQEPNRYARPMLPPEPEIESGMLKLPMLDTTAFRQVLYLEVGKPVLAARISNPAYQPDMLTLFFVTATVEDAPK
ncbi:MAG: hypothetical protein J6W70_06405 [Lentisphaeria bacterium]|nr:hypothetical protein [Lentisphaeria bacterium]